MNPIRVGFAVTGSFCTLARALEQMKRLSEQGNEILPIFSEHTAETDTRFGKASDFMQRASEIAGCPVICSIAEAEPIGPKNMTDIMVVAPCTGNTLAKLALGMTDSAVAMAVKSHLRGGKPVVLAIATNDALGASAQNIGRLMNTRNYYFVPFSQDAPLQKPKSVVADFTQLSQTVAAALRGEQLQPLLLSQES